MCGCAGDSLFISSFSLSLQPATSPPRLSPMSKMAARVFFSRAPSAFPVPRFLRLLTFSSSCCCCFTFNRWRRSSENKKKKGQLWPALSHKGEASILFGVDDSGPEEGEGGNLKWDDGTKGVSATQPSGKTLRGILASLSPPL